jgi:iron complex transport system substrate-binding protein
MSIKFLRLLFSIIFILVIIVILEGSSPAYPERIISLAPSITKTLYLLGVGDRVIANTIHCNYPPPAIKKEKIGNVIDINVEKIYSLNPDLVIATPLTDLKAKKRLTDLGINVVTIPSPKNYLELCDQFLRIGKLVGREERAKEIISNSKKEIKKIMGKIRDKEKPKVLVQVGSRPLWVGIKDSFINDFVNFAGGQLVGPKNFGIFSKEEVLKQNPDVIIIASMGGSALEEKRDWERYKVINAVKNHRIYIFESDELTSPTPVSFVEVLIKICRILHPDK